jgi:hypothetical protein
MTVRHVYHMIAKRLVNLYEGLKITPPNIA